MACERPAWLVPGDETGCEGIGPEDTFDAGYGRLLDRAYEKDVKGGSYPTRTDCSSTAIDRWIAA
jgi:hypothetical protein